MNFFDIFKARPAAQEATVSSNAIDRASDFEQFFREHAEPLAEIKSTCKPNVQHNPAVRIKATGAVVPATAPNLALVTAGLAEKINLPMGEAQQGDGRFVANNNKFTDAPQIQFACPHCAMSIIFRPAADKSAEQISVQHCGRVQVITDDVVKHYVALTKEAQRKFETAQRNLKG